jgi:formamidopyrimidine-DNA glycosylase
MKRPARVAIEREHGRVVFICDSPRCRRRVETREGVFARAVQIFKDKGGTIDRTWSGGRYRHFCGKCQL